MVESPRLTIRKTDELAAQRLEASGYHPLLSRLWAARGVTRAEDVRLGWPAMLPPAGLTQSEHAACLLASAETGGLTSVPGNLETLMAGLACGEPSLLAWQELDRAAAAFLAIPDAAAVDCMKLLAKISKHI